MNALDDHFLRGQPVFFRFFMGFHRPPSQVRGYDVAGQVVAIGENARRYKPGDEMYGTGSSTFAEYALVSEASSVPKPSRLSFDQACAQNPLWTPAPDPSGAIGAGGAVVLVIGIVLIAAGATRRPDD